MDLLPGWSVKKKSTKRPTFWESEHMREDLFFDLSITLTGSPNLNRTLVPGLLVRLREVPEAGLLDELLSIYEAILAEPSGHDELIRERIMKVPSLNTVAKLIIVL